MRKENLNELLTLKITVKAWENSEMIQKSYNEASATLSPKSWIDLPATLKHARKESPRVWIRPFLFCSTQVLKCDSGTFL